MNFSLRSEPLLLALLLVCAGCSQAPPDPRAARNELTIQEIVERLDKLERNTVAQVEQRQAESEAAAAQRMQALEQQLAELVREQASTVARLRRELDRRGAQIKELESTTVPSDAAVGAGSTNAVQAAVDAGGAGNGEPELAPGFPLLITAVSAKKVESGRITIPKYVETEETYRDKFGKVRGVIEKRDEVHVQYRYEVEFTAHNPSGEARSLTAKAGQKEKKFELLPGQVAPGLSVTAARGAPLLIQVGGFSQSFDVQY